MKIVVEGPQIAAHLESVREAAGDARLVHVTGEQALLGAVGDAEVLFGGAFREELVRAAPRLKWFQSAGAGMDWMPREAVKRAGWVFTNAAGVHAIPVAETAMALLTGVARHMGLAVRAHAARQWRRAPEVFEIHGKTAGVIALGGIGREFARMAAGMSMRVLAVDVNPPPKPDFVQEVRKVGELEWLLRNSDVVVMAAPDTPASHHMMNAERFAQMKQGAIFLNVSRGGLVDTDALLAALDSGRLFGAGLDVVEGEPLGSDHPIWDREDVLLTAHLGGSSPNRGARLAALFIENIKRYRAGTELRNVVNVEAGF